MSEPDDNSSPPKHLALVMPIYERLDLVKNQIAAFLRPRQLKNVKLSMHIVSDGNSEIYNKELAHYIRSHKFTSGGRGLITYSSLTKNSGPGAARNLALKKINSDFIGFVDSDDLIQSTFYESLEEIINNSDNNSQVIYLEHDETELLHSSVLEHYNFPTAFALNLVAPDPPRFLVSCSFLREKNIYFPEILHEDLSFAFKVAHAATHIERVKVEGYSKIRLKDSITASIGESRVKDYFRNYEIMLDSAGSLFPERWPLISYAIARTVREIARLGEGDSLNLLQVVKSSVKASDLKAISNWIDSGIPAPKPLPPFFRDTVYYKIIRSFIAGSSEEKLLGLAKENLSCKDLEGSFFLAPEEIRTCCKRFFRNGVRKGDVKLIEIKELNSSGGLYERALREKRRIYNEINLGLSSECGNCPHIVTKDAPKFNTVDYLSIENQTVCNMRCTYCDETYYGGEKGVPYVHGFIDELAESADFSPTVVVWGGGEPTISSDFVKISERLSRAPTLKALRILTNSLQFSPKLVTLLERQANAQVITSIDAGTPKTFSYVRGVSKGELLSKVLDNLRRYEEIAPGRITLKYIFTSANGSLNEIDFFLRECEKNRLHKTCLQISTDFKESVISKNRLSSILNLFKYGKTIFKGGVVIDELIRRRLDYTDSSIRELVLDFVSKEHLETLDLVIIGTGEMLELVTNSFSYKRLERVTCVDVKNFPEAARRLSVLSEKGNLRLFIAAVQGYSLIRKSMLTLIDEKNLDFKALSML